MKHSPREEFFWWEAAVQLDAAELTARSAPPLSDEERKSPTPGNIQRSRCEAETLLIALGKSEISFNKSDARRAIDAKDLKPGEIRSGSLILNGKNTAKAYVRATGNTDDRIVAWAMSKGILSKADERKAKRVATERERKEQERKKQERSEEKQQPRPEYARKEIKDVLVEFWCGDPGIYGSKLNLEYGSEIFALPPLCFFTNAALATFLAFALGKKQSDPSTSETAIRKLVSRLGLLHAANPKIRDVKFSGSEITFCP